MKKYAGLIINPKSGDKNEEIDGLQLLQLNQNLKILFSRKQKELVLKKLQGETFTKTEREYYSRVVRKKLEAMANGDLIEVATRLTKNKRKTL